ncbi:uncharacterized protein LOC119100793 [Pollicipes pollicipes]|uniref:uncharacterized protein LOC119100793 n=1 Tax=Pollicipes pollicipes TaxID=41117 RepID=UPI001884C2E6|nr:uncharacterized protein LOC119100793 [Pollicipes pollicipes]
MSVPFSFHAVSKVRENMNKGDGQHQRSSTPQASAKQNSWTTGQVSADLQSYSSKMMKAIWGQYNQYSVHNIKSNQALAGADAARSQTKSGTERARGEDRFSVAGLFSSQ